MSVMEASSNKEKVGEDGVEEVFSSFPGSLELRPLIKGLSERSRVNLSPMKGLS